MAAHTAFVGAQLAGDGDLKDAIAGKPYADLSPSTGELRVDEHEAFVMKPTALPLNVAVLAGCRILSESATNPFQIQPFT
jgi:hypothetical protein